MRRLGREVQSQIDYILWTYSRLFRSVSVWEYRHNSDYFVVIGCICGAALRDISSYLGQYRWFPPTPPDTEDLGIPVVRRPAAGYYKSETQV